MTINLFTGLAFLLCAALLGFREILLSPASGRFPCEPTSVRVAMFFAFAALTGLGVMFVSVPAEPPYAGKAADAVAVTAAILAFYNFVMLVNVATQRRGPGFWNRIDRFVHRRQHPVELGGFHRL